MTLQEAPPAFSLRSFSLSFLTSREVVAHFLCLEKSKSGTNSSLQTIRKDNLDKLIFAHMSINSIRNKFDSLADIRKDNIDILMILETNVDDTFPDNQFFLGRFGAPIRLDRNRNGGGIILFIRNDILAKGVSTDDRPIESFYVELNFRKKK